MASDTPHKQEFRIRDLSTRSVLLFPTRAQIIRDIKSISLQPVANQIVIYGLSPLVDEHSIKVEGTGSATITDVTVDLLPNREVYEDIYPSDSEDEDESEAEDSDAEVEEMRDVNDRIKRMHILLLHEQEKINSAADRLKICDYFGKSLEKHRPAPGDLNQLLLAYDNERQKIYHDHEVATAAVSEVREVIRQAEKEKMKLAKALVKANEKVEKEKAKEREKISRMKAEVAQEKKRITTERESFWPKKVYCITINLEPSSLTPASSRQSSMDGETIVNLATSEFHEPSYTPLKNGEISLSLSYITHGASWAPRYDLSLNTVKCTGLLEYGAELRNTTSETWRDAKVILSTSRTTFGGLGESFPVLLPWHVHLEKGARNADSSLFSQDEINAKHREWKQTKVDQNLKPRHELFGRDNAAKKARLAQENQNQLAFGASAAVPVAENLDDALTYHLRSMVQHDRSQEKEADSYTGSGPFDHEPAAPMSLTFEEGAWEESGMTTTYDVPGTKTLVPNNSTIKHKIAKIDFKNVIFSHIVVGKLRQVAFLKARIYNASKITLLKGPVGVTLDGSFLGQATFPCCTPGGFFSLPLGVDPAINIIYPKPTVCRRQSGIFNKEDSNVFTRTVVITNTKHDAPVELTVLDQVPVSEDERLKIEIANPRGLKIGGGTVRAVLTPSAAPNPPSSARGTAKDARAGVYGADGEDPAAQKPNWGSAVASAKKGGEVVWNVKLNPGQGVVLTLEYEATFPGGERVVSSPTARNR